VTPEIRFVGQNNRRVLVYMDTLGFKKRVENALANPLAQRELYNALKRLKREEGRGFEVSTFSDHLAGSMSVDASNLSDLFDAVVDVSMALIANVGLLVRGAVVVGDLTHDKGVILGPALIEAWDMEREKVEHPSHRSS
jgi:hypothetical protein